MQGTCKQTLSSFFSWALRIVSAKRLFNIACRWSFWGETCLSDGAFPPTYDRGVRTTIHWYQMLLNAIHLTQKTCLPSWWSSALVETGLDWVEFSVWFNPEPIWGFDIRLVFNNDFMCFRRQHLVTEETHGFHYADQEHHFSLDRRLHQDLQLPVV